MSKDSSFHSVVRENIVGYYSSSNKLNAIDLEIDEMFRKYCKEPVSLLSLRDE